MKVILSWSGHASNQLARALRKWLPDVVQSLRPWMSEEDIRKGSWWSTELQDAMRDSKACIVCLTPENLTSLWTHFEAGYLANSIGKSLVCPYLLRIRKVDVSGPMAQLQLTSAEREDTFRLLSDLNAFLVENGLDAERLRRSFDLHWPLLESELARIEVSTASQSVSRTDSEILSEILDQVRTMSKPSDIVMSKPADVVKWLQRRIDKLMAAAHAPDDFGENPEYPASPTDEQRREWTARAASFRKELEEQLSRKELEEKLRR